MLDVQTDEQVSNYFPAQAGFEVQVQFQCAVHELGWLVIVSDCTFYLCLRLIVVGTLSKDEYKKLTIDEWNRGVQSPYQPASQVQSQLNVGT